MTSCPAETICIRLADIGAVTVVIVGAVVMVVVVALFVTWATSAK